MSRSSGKAEGTNLSTITVRRVGSNVDKQVDVRIIAATNRDLRTEVNRGLFREDLFFRLSVIQVRMPPLRERREDIVMLAEHFLHQLKADGGELPPSLRQQLFSNKWPGNVRELRNAVERALVLPTDATFATAQDQFPDPAVLAVDTDLPFKVFKRRVVDAYMRPYLVQAMAESGGNVSATARKLQLDRVHLLKLLRGYGLR